MKRSASVFSYFIYTAWENKQHLVLQKNSKINMFYKSILPKKNEVTRPEQTLSANLIEYGLFARFDLIASRINRTSFPRKTQQCYSSFNVEISRYYYPIATTVPFSNLQTNYTNSHQHTTPQCPVCYRATLGDNKTSTSKYAHCSTEHSTRSQLVFAKHFIV